MILPKFMLWKTDIDLFGPCESRVHSGSENIYHSNSRKICLKYKFCTMWESVKDIHTPGGGGVCPKRTIVDKGKGGGLPNCVRTLFQDIHYETWICFVLE